jgi:hypothetical protein
MPRIEVEHEASRAISRRWYLQVTAHLARKKISNLDVAGHSRSAAIGGIDEDGMPRSFM